MQRTLSAKSRRGFFIGTTRCEGWRRSPGTTTCLNRLCGVRTGMARLLAPCSIAEWRAASIVPVRAAREAQCQPIVGRGLRRLPLSRPANWLPRATGRRDLRLAGRFDQQVLATTMRPLLREGSERSSACNLSKGAFGLRRHPDEPPKSSFPVAFVFIPRPFRWGAASRTISWTIL
jgi:hypothetical protein